VAAGVADHFIDAIDWRSPWLAPWEALGEPLAQRARAGAAVHAALQEAAERRSLPIAFAPQAALPEGEAYEAFIFASRRVPTRDNLHDFFNGLAWLQFAQAKRRMNALQAQAIAAHGVGAVRGPLRDAITVFDENGALLQAPEPLWEALHARDWQRLFLDLRPLWTQARLTLFGHALLEKLVSPRKSIVAHVYPAPAAINSIVDLDGWLSAAIEPGGWSAKPFCPLPVLGMPGWWSANGSPDFYADAAVFRPHRGAPPQFPSRLV
jgi:hypothetical protein